MKSCKLIMTALAWQICMMQSPPSLCFHSYLWNWLTVDLELCMPEGNDHRSQGIEDQGHRSRSRVRLLRSVRPRLRAVFTSNAGCRQHSTQQTAEAQMTHIIRIMCYDAKTLAEKQEHIIVCLPAACLLTTAGTTDYWCNALRRRIANMS